MKIKEGSGYATKLKVAGKQPQGGKRVVVKLKAGANSGVSFVASGKVKAGSKSYRLKGVQKSSKNGKLKKVKLKASEEDSRKILRRLDDGRKTTAKVKVKFVNNAGKRSTEKAKTKLVAR